MFLFHGEVVLFGHVVDGQGVRKLFVGSFRLRARPMGRILKFLVLGRIFPSFHKLVREHIGGPQVFDVEESGIKMERRGAGVIPDFKGNVNECSCSVILRLRLSIHCRDGYVR